MVASCAFPQQMHGMKTRSGGHIQHGTGAVLAQQLHEEVSLRILPGIPVDQSIPAIGELFDVFLLIVIRFTNRLRRIAKMLMVRISGRELVLR